MNATCGRSERRCNRREMLCSIDILRRFLHTPVLHIYGILCMGIPVSDIRL